MTPGICISLCGKGLYPVSGVNYVKVFSGTIDILLTSACVAYSSPKRKSLVINVGVRPTVLSLLSIKATVQRQSYYHMCRGVTKLNYFYILLLLLYIRTIERNADVLLNACKVIGLTVNIGKAKCMEIGRHRGMKANEHIKIVIPMKK